jgi:hypothetical protein
MQNVVHWEISHDPKILFLSEVLKLGAQVDGNKPQLLNLQCILQLSPNNKRRQK